MVRPVAVRNWREDRRYQPRLAVIDGRVLSNYSNQDLNFATYYYLNKRWTLNINDSFSHIGDRRLYGGFSLDGDLSTGQFVRNSFLDTGGHLLSDTASFNFVYLWS